MGINVHKKDGLEDRTNEINEAILVLRKQWKRLPYCFRFSSYVKVIALLSLETSSIQQKTSQRSWDKNSIGCENDM